MRYFYIGEDKEITNKPQIMNWYKKIDERNLHYGTYHKVPEKIVLYIKSNKETYYPEVISTPFFMISKKIKDIIKLYEPNMGYRQVILIDFDNEKATQYFIPHLKRFDCLTEESKFNKYHSLLTKIVIDSNKVGDSCIFELDNVSDRHIIVRMDFLESMLRRGAMIEFKEVVVGEEN